MLPMKNINSLASTKIDKAWAVNNSMAHEPMSTKNATQRVVEILDANMKRQTSKQWWMPLAHTSVSKTRTSYWIYSRNLRNEGLFDMTLGDWKTEPVSFELKEGAKPYHGRPYPGPNICKETTIKEFNRFCELGVMEFWPASEWVSHHL